LAAQIVQQATANGVDPQTALPFVRDQIAAAGIDINALTAAIQQIVAGSTAQPAQPAAAAGGQRAGRGGGRGQQGGARAGATAAATAAAPAEDQGDDGDVVVAGL